MAKHGGYMGGMPGNMNNLMKQAQRMQQQMQQKQEELENKDYTATAGGGAVQVTVSGKCEVKEVLIDKEVVDPEDVEMLQDLIMTATNEALRSMEAESAEMMNDIAGGLGGFGGLGGLFGRQMPHCYGTRQMPRCYGSRNDYAAKTGRGRWNTTVNISAG